MWYLKTRSKKLADLTAGYKLFSARPDGYYIYGNNPYSSERAYFRGYSDWPKLYKTESAAKAQVSRLVAEYAETLSDLTDFTIDICRQEPSIIDQVKR